MIRRLILFSCLIASSFNVTGQIQLKYTENKSLDYNSLIESYKYLADKYKEGKLITFGPTDVGKQLHLFVIDFDAQFNPQTEKTIVLINNGIHPGEPCGIDASVKLAQELLKTKDPKMKNIILCIIPVYNVGGMLNRGVSRVNQNGPEEYGFRGNYQNLDLNRDFIKLDSKNAAGFTTIFKEWDPDIFIDTHTTNGSQYQYTLSLITTQLSKLQRGLSDYVSTEMLPWLYKSMKSKDKEITPYVYGLKRTPDHGIKDFLETPRYSSGYASLFNAIGFITESHKFKPFKERVEHTHAFLSTILEYADKNGKKIQELRAQAFAKDATDELFPIRWKLDTAKSIDIDFKGYGYSIVKSDLTGLDKLNYKLDEPKNYKIKYYNRYLPTASAKAPKYYVSPQCYNGVVYRLRLNGVQLERLTQDSIINVDAYYIEKYETGKQPFEKHYVHSDVKLSSKKQRIQFYEGDYLISMNQKNRRFLINTLEPEAHDSYFNWNFFDNILQQKEYFSGYAFEETAKEMLAKDAKLKSDFEAKKASDEEFAKSSWLQLQFIFQRSRYYEKSHKRYPVYKIVD